MWEAHGLAAMGERTAVKSIQDQSSPHPTWQRWTPEYPLLTEALRTPDGF
ncbi:rCG43980 [Rattus norvegicus]|uniref:RCG43980 n=1 Tax=Rattus norvegicus TaxID=10116 RepID=A6J738_RAT|nr:rCG43980 [Rattus norvegicus]